MKPYAFWAMILLGCSSFLFFLPAQETRTGQPWVVFQGKTGPGNSRHAVFIAADDEYHSEEIMPLLARILAERHGFKCTVLFPINKQGAIDPGVKDNIPGLENLTGADLMVVFTRFRQLPDAQMKMIVDYLDSGRPVIGLRTSTHGFNYAGNSSSPYKKFSYNYKGTDFEGGFGRQVLGETWINHWGKHGGQSTRAVFAPGAAESPILRGIKDGEIWGPTDVYEVRLPLPKDCQPLLMGQVLSGMDPNDGPAATGEDPRTKKPVDKNSPMMPVAWTKTYTGAQGKAARVFTTTMGGAMVKTGKSDIENETLRRLLINACYWAVGLEDKIPDKADVTPVGENPFKRGVKPQDVVLN